MITAIFLSACINLSVNAASADYLYILDSSVITSENNTLCYIPNTYIEKNFMQEIHLFQNQLLSACYVEEYGVSIKIADQCAVDYYDKTVSQECNTAKITTTLQTLQKAFANYPDNFWKQLRYGTYREIEINLMGVKFWNMMPCTERKLCIPKKTGPL